MGLEITAYARCTRTDDEENGNDVVAAYVNPHFPERADDVVHEATYRFERSVDFGAGTYDAYDEWRRELARLGGYEASDAWTGRVTHGPFIEMVAFADNEGVIGPVTSAKLAADFAAHEDEARARMSERDLKRYGRWMEAFATAAEGGFLRFH